MRIEEIEDFVRVTVMDLYTPHVFINEAGHIGLAIGENYKGALTVAEIMVVKHSPKEFLKLLKSKMEKVQC